MNEKETKEQHKANISRMINHLITAITFTITLGIISGAPLHTCDKIQGKSFTNRYKVTL